MGTRSGHESVDPGLCWFYAGRQPGGRTNLMPYNVKYQIVDYEYHIMDNY